MLCGFLVVVRTNHGPCCIRCIKYIGLRVSQQSFPQTECQEFQVYQVCQASLSGSGSQFQSFRVSGVSTVSLFELFQVCSVFGADSEQNARYFFGVVELMLMFVGGVDVVVGSHLAPG